MPTAADFDATPAKYDEVTVEFSFLSKVGADSTAIIDGVINYLTSQGLDHFRGITRWRFTRRNILRYDDDEEE